MLMHDDPEVRKLVEEAAIGEDCKFWLSRDFGKALIEDALMEREAAISEFFDTLDPYSFTDLISLQNEVMKIKLKYKIPVWGISRANDAIHRRDEAIAQLEELKNDE